jgi:hypothetical protein
LNANELANKLNEEGDVSYITLDKAATMLRQQQAEIEALKNKVKSYKNLGNMMLDELLEKGE